MTFGRICNSPAASVSICNAKILIHWQSVCLLLGFRISYCKCFHSQLPNFKFGRTEKLGFFRPRDLILGAHRPDIQTVETVVVVVRVDAARAEAEVARAVGEVRIERTRPAAAVRTCAVETRIVAVARRRQEMAFAAKIVIIFLTAKQSA